MNELSGQGRLVPVGEFVSRSIGVATPAGRGAQGKVVSTMPQAMAGSTTMLLASGPDRSAYNVLLHSNVRRGNILRNI